MPILVAPMAYQRMADDEGDAATARTAPRLGIVMVVSTVATVSLEDVAAVAPGALRWFQLYVQRDRALTEQLVKRGAGAGYEAIVLTVDAPILGYRARDERNRFALPPGPVSGQSPVSDPARRGAPGSPPSRPASSTRPSRRPTSRGCAGWSTCRCW